jgi:UPF0755 protein
MSRYVVGKKGSGLRKLWKILAVILAIAILSVVFIIRSIYNSNLGPVSASQKNVLVTVAVGASVKEIALQLEEKGLIKAAWAFEWYVRNSNTRSYLQAGTYNLKPSQGVKGIVSVLTNGDVAKNLVTFREGIRLDQVRAALINNAGFSEAEVDAALKPELYKDEPAIVDKPPFANLEGYLYPDSYEKTAETKPEDIIRASLKEMHEYLTPDIRAAFNKRGMTVYEAITLASIVLQESGSPEDMPKIAQVFLSRLEQDMPLQSDPTIIYGALKANQPASLKFDSDYNTYTHKGLPPGPISNVTKEALQAVANPAETDYLYFVAGDDGVTYFSRTLAEHERLTELHCKELCNPAD